MNKIREHKKLSIIVLVVLAILVILSIAFGRYLLNIINNYILETKGFYFNSSVLAVNTKNYNIRNWDGVNSYSLTIDLNNRKNSLIKTNEDIRYDVVITCSTNVTCSSSKNSSTIYKDDEEDSFIVTMVPQTTFTENDEAIVRIEAKSTSPYKKTLSAVYHIGIAKSNFSYEIEDAPGDIYMTLKMTNSLTYYTVDQAFGDYAVGDPVSLEAYDALSDTDKAKCSSATVTLSFDPNTIILDMTNSSYIHRVPNSQTTTPIGGYDYVNGYTLKIPAASSEQVIFYKKNRSMNYTYPIVNPTSIVNLTVTLAQ